MERISQETKDWSSSETLKHQNLIRAKRGLKPVKKKERVIYFIEAN